MVTKIFCIGFHKTGTTSLATALETLGYRPARSAMIVQRIPDGVDVGVARRNGKTAHLMKTRPTGIVSNARDAVGH